MRRIFLVQAQKTKIHTLSHSNVVSIQHNSTQDQHHFGPNFAAATSPSPNQFTIYSSLSSNKQNIAPSNEAEDCHSPSGYHSSPSETDFSSEYALVTSITASADDNPSGPPTLTESSNFKNARVPPTNQHSMTTRAKSGIFKLEALLTHFEPTTVT